MTNQSEIHRPPTPIAGLSLRAWLAGCALANPNVVRASDPAGASHAALSAADALLAALQPPNVPDEESLGPPSEAEMAHWEAKIRHDKDVATKVTQPAIPYQRKHTVPFSPTVDDQSAARAAFSSATQELRKASAPALPVARPGFYSITEEEQ